LYPESAGVPRRSAINPPPSISSTWTSFLGSTEWRRPRTAPLPGAAAPQHLLELSNSTAPQRQTNPLDHHTGSGAAVLEITARNRRGGPHAHRQSRTLWCWRLSIFRPATGDCLNFDGQPVPAEQFLLVEHNNGMGGVGDKRPETSRCAPTSSAMHARHAAGLAGTLCRQTNRRIL